MPESLDLLLERAIQAGLAPEQLMLEITEGEAVQRPKEFSRLLNAYRARGVLLAIDDFGAGYSGRTCGAAGLDDLGIEVIAEGVETIGEYDWFRRVGVRLFQGYLLARPAFETLEAPAFPG